MQVTTGVASGTTAKCILQFLKPNKKSDGRHQSLGKYCQMLLLR